jgi:hypothetical protein
VYLRDELLKRVAGKIFRPGPYNEEWPQNAAGLLSVQIAKRLLEPILRLAIEAIEAKLVKVLALVRRYADQKIKKLRCLRIERAGIVLEGRDKKSA